MFLIYLNKYGKKCQLDYKIKRQCPHTHFVFFVHDTKIVFLFIAGFPSHGL